MTLENAISFAIKALEWRDRESPDKLTVEIKETLTKLSNKEFLDERHRKLIAFSLFTYSMKNGPSLFDDTESCAAKLGVGAELCSYASDYINFALNERRDHFLSTFKNILNGR